ncbi:hypothetical protein BU16DRAFT_544945 [Lophium mytilinum]|uniref:Transcription regulator Rua1 C-terminal domain-containing protein n=1 Tax=Lophium mytilinum TaxID=390894 RepID=A0A6A6Q9Y4_9PEZI|nr:hypothetical protein BU16DRAFT_544945 [Lophium mytilinum]
MYPYGNIPLQPQHTQNLQRARPTQPFPLWAIQHNHNSYTQVQKGSGVNNKDGNASVQWLDQPDGSTARAPAIAPQAYRSLNLQEPIPPEYFGSTLIDNNPWAHKACDDMEGFPQLDPDISEYGHSMIANDDDTPIIDLRQYAGLENESDITAFNSGASRRMSESSFSMSSTGGMPEVSTSYEDMPASEAVSYASDCEAWNSLEHAPSLISPLASPRRSQHDSHSVVRSGSRSRASPAPHNNMRSSPYTVDSGRFKRWSTGHTPTSTPTGSRNINHAQDRFASYGARLNPHHSMPAYPPSALNTFQLHTQNVLYSQPHPLQSSNPALFASPDQPFHLEVPRPLPSQGLFRLLQSNADRHSGCSSHFADLSDPPDLYSSLHDNPSNPPEADMHPSDVDLTPHEQDLRFGGDLYTPRWVRGHGNKREGWCGLCKPGRWLVLKNSAFWYDKSFTHGVSAATGAAFQGPQETRRTEGNLDVWEGLCGSCGDWIALVSSKKKGTTWFRHAYKCHSHPKVKDGPKRRRETSHTARARAVSSASASSSSYPVNKEASQDAHTLKLSVSSVSQSMTTKVSEVNHAFSAKEEPVVGLFSPPLHSISTFNRTQSTNQGENRYRQEKPELVGVKTISPLSSLTSMI